MRLLLRIILIVVAVVLVAFAVRVLSVYEFREGECSPDPEYRTARTGYLPRLRVMSYNIEGHAALFREDHIEQIATTIRTFKPDIVGINEAHRNTWQSRFSDHVDELRRRTGMNAVFGESYQQFGGQFGNLVLTRGKIVSTDVKKLPGTGEPRTLLRTTIEIDGARIDFYVTHLTAWQKLNAATRDRQLRCVEQHVRASDHPWVLTGDLNAAPEADEIERFLRSGTGLRAVTGPTHKVVDASLDYVVAEPGWRIDAARAVDAGPSDHRPIIAELSHVR